VDTVRIVGATEILAGIYALALASADPWDLALGAGLGLAVVLTFRGFVLPGAVLPAWQVARRLVGLPPLLAATLVEVARGTVAVARAVLAPARARHAGFVVLPVLEQTEAGVAMTGLLTTLSPGSVLIEVDPQAQTRTMHVLDASSPEEVAEQVRQFYERFQRPVWP
jgi:multisubunit Na+/H+ antiporter MnhE subunit